MGVAVLSIYQVKVSQGLSVVCGCPLQQVVSAAVLSHSLSLSLSCSLSLSLCAYVGGRVRREEPLSVDINVNLSSGRLLLKTSVGEDNLLSGVISGGQIGMHDTELVKP